MVLLQSLVPWLAALFSLVLAYPWARWLLALPHPVQQRPPPQPVLLAVLTTGLSLGALAWGTMLLSALSPALVRFDVITLVNVLIAAAGWAAWRRRARHFPPAERPMFSRAGLGTAPQTNRLLALVALIVVGVCGLILLNAAAWPFLEDDTIQLYGLTALQVARTGELAPEPDQRGAYDSYPVLVPLAFVYPHLAAGAPHEYAARFVAAVLAVGMAGAAFVLGQDLYDRKTGLGAALLVMTTPILAHWAASGYTDLPAGTYYTLAAIFAWRLFKRGHRADAVLTGLMAGLAVFTKNGAWLLVGSLAGWVMYTHWVTRRARRQQAALPAGFAIGWRPVLWMLAAFLVVAGPWYAHTLLTFGYLVPATGWTSQAVRNPVLLAAALFTTFSHFAFSGGPLVVGLGVALLQLVRERHALGRWSLRPRLALLLGFSVPFLLVWWWLFSYDYRFLLMVWAFFGVMGARWIVVLLEAAAQRLPAGWRPRLVLGLAVLLVVMAIPAALIAVDNKPELLRNPLMSDLERHRVQLGPRYDAMLWLQAIAPPDAWILTTDYHVLYYLRQTHDFAAFRAAQQPEYVRQFAYWLLGPNVSTPDWASDETLSLLYDQAGYRVYAVHLPPPDAADS